MPSEQEAQAPPAQDPSEQASSHVSALPSSQEAVLLVWVQAPELQASSVQALLSSHSESWEHSGQVLPAQAPSEQTSLHVPELPSSQEPVLLVFWQVPPAQLSFVQELLSLHSQSWEHSGQVLPAQAQPEQTSLHVPELPSSQEAVLLVLVHVPELQASSVQTLVSAHCESWVHGQTPQSAGQLMQSSLPLQLPFPQEPPQAASVSMLGLLSAQL